MLPAVSGEFGVVADPVITFSEKGNAFLKIRGVAKDRVRDANGTWGDGDPCFIDLVAFGKNAENMFDSVRKGDSVMAYGKLEQKEWTDKEGTKHNSYRLNCETLGVSVRWTPAKTPRTLEDAISGVQAAVEGFNATEMPF